MSKAHCRFSPLWWLSLLPPCWAASPTFAAWPQRRIPHPRAEGRGRRPGERRRGKDSLLPGPHAPLVSLRQAGDRARLRHEVGAGLRLGGGSAEAGERKILYYQDAMNPSHHSDKPGIAPDGMKLVPVYASEVGRGAPTRGVEISPARQQLMGVTTAQADTARSTRRCAPSARSRWMRRAWRTST